MYSPSAYVTIVTSFMAKDLIRAKNVKSLRDCSFEVDQPPSHGIVGLLSQTILSKRCPTSRHTLGTSLEVDSKFEKA